MWLSGLATRLFTITPMVHEKSRHLLNELYGHGSTQDQHACEGERSKSADRSTPYGYGDMFMADMDPNQIGKVGTHPQNLLPIEIVLESDLDFERFKKRGDFREQFGGDGELYGRLDDLISRPETPSTFATMTDGGLYGRGGHVNGVSTTRDSSRTHLGENDTEVEGTSYRQGYQPTSVADREGFEPVDVSIPLTPLDAENILGTSRTARNGSQGTNERLLDAEGDGGYFGDTFRHWSQDISYERSRD
ncbi:hypothetical protein P154DRAFT_592515 [Amniculicola lignicola CBS 123094]|uniref:Uncharacterized protein n=1 Tax=Amniculicola lignicola CBS 123094 TaxID=1392246 RepID=A0A6A5X195_9PLEO|nr:hypothetical protein P154DRAFT_592515 [Amniculicola lignicola CBS 123094]